MGIEVTGLLAMAMAMALGIPQAPGGDRERPIAEDRERWNADERWAAAARARYWKYLDDAALDHLGLDPGAGSRSPDDEGRAAWPFDGLAPRPARFPAAGRASTRPAGSIEWRRSPTGQYLESFVEGDARILDLARETRRDAASRHAADSESSSGRPATAWARDPEVPIAFDPAIAFSDDWHAGTLRARWCSAWTDCYEIGPTGLVLLVTVDVAANWSELRVARVDGNGSLEIRRLPGAEYFTWQAPTSGALLLATDLDGNGTRDFLFASIGCGNSACRLDGVVVMASPDGARVRCSPLDSLGAALIDLDGNGRAEILTRHYASVERCTDGKPHNFWVTQLLGFQDLQVVDLREVHAIRHGAFVGRFPSFEWFSFDPEDRFRPLLTDGQRRALGATPYPPYRRPGASTR